jgi:plastocyanin
MRVSPSRRVRSLTVIVAAAALLAACGGGDEAAQGPTPTGDETTIAPSPTPSATPEPIEVGGGEPVDLKLVVRLDFLRQRFEVPPGAEVTLTFVNDDPVPHNFSLYVDDSRAESIFEGQRILSGTVTYEFGAPVEPGTYHFVCDVHPEVMNGDFVVG